MLPLTCLDYSSCVLHRSAHVGRRTRRFRTLPRRISAFSWTSRTYCLRGSHRRESCLHPNKIRVCECQLEDTVSLFELYSHLQEGVEERQDTILTPIASPDPRPLVVPAVITLCGDRFCHPGTWLEEQCSSNSVRVEHHIKARLVDPL